MPNTIIIGSGSYIPEKIVDNSHFMDTKFYDENNNLIEKSNEEIIQKFVEITEIEERRYINNNENNSDIAYRASELAIQDAGINRENIDYIICASNFGEINTDGFSSFMPSMSARIKNKLGIKNRKCVNYDMIFGCPGWVEAMILADSLIKAKRAKTILVVGSETPSRALDPHDRNKMIFADGAGAVIVTATQENVGIISSATICDNQEETFYLDMAPSLNGEHDQNKSYIRMAGRKIYEYVLNNVPAAIKETIDHAGIGIDDIQKILIHQANAKMDYAIIPRLHKLFGKQEYDHNITPMIIQKLGNTSVASIPTMYDLITKGKMEGHSLEKGAYIVMCSVGAGMNINAFVYKMPH